MTGGTESGSDVGVAQYTEEEADRGAMAIQLLNGRTIWVHSGFRYTFLALIWRYLVSYDMFSVDLPLFNVRNKGSGRGHYLFGIDSVWHGATNELVFMMSLKMKHSVLFCVVRMLLEWSNTIFKRSCIDFICECVHMMIFMLCFFCWMDFMIRNLSRIGVCSQCPNVYQCVIGLDTKVVGAKCYGEEDVWAVFCIGRFFLPKC